MRPKPFPPVNKDFLNSNPARNVTVQRPRFGDEAYMYHPRESGLNPMGPLRPLADFTNSNFARNKEIDAVFLCDPGTDDMIAGFLALDQSSRLNIRMIIPSFGNVNGEQTFQNTLTLISLTKAFGVTVAKGSQAPIGNANPEDASAEHGEDGLNGATPKNPEEVQKDKNRIKILQNGVEILTNDIIRRFEKDEPSLAILNTGTMTDIALVLQALEERMPQAISKIRGISMMGCGIDRGNKLDNGELEKWHTNITHHAEFNINKDPAAAAIAFQIIEKCKIPTIILPLDLTHQTGVRQTHEGKWLRQKAEENGNSVAHFAAQLYHAGDFDIERSRGIYGFSENDITRFMHDPNAVTALNMPEHYSGFPASVQITTKGEEAGRSVIQSQGQSSIFVVVKADAENILWNWQNTLANFSLKQGLSAPSV